LFRRAESNHTTSLLAFPETREKGSAFRVAAQFSPDWFYCRCVVFPLSKKLELSLFATSHRALIAPRRCRARALDVRALRRSYYSKWPL
jgi:hypothetical protein